MEHHEMRLAAEMIVAPVNEDDFGQSAEATSTFLRYELHLAYEPPSRSGYAQYGRIRLVAEELRHITKFDASKRLQWEHSASKFRDAAVINRRQGVAYISTAQDAGAGTIKIHQDGGSRGQPRSSSADRAPRSVVSLTTTSDDPTILAARREMQQWRVLALEPTAMRTPDAVSDPSQISASGAHLASTLFRLASDGGVPDAYARVAALAASLTDVREVSVDLDPHREMLTLQAAIGRGGLLPARALSDGTLRFLALCIMSIDPLVTGLVCMEEPENGIHPGRINSMVELVKSLAVDPLERPSDENPLRQIVVNTHSPYFVVNQRPEDVLMALPVTTRRNDQLVETVRLAPLVDTWRTQQPGIHSVSLASIVDYLRTPPGAQLSLDFAVPIDA